MQQEDVMDRMRIEVRVRGKSEQIPFVLLPSGEGG